MLGPLNYLFQLLQQKQQEQQQPRLVPPGMALPYQDITQQPAAPTPRFRDPDQTGPAPPVNGPLAAMFGGRSG